MNLDEFVSVLFAFPTNVFFIPLIILFIIMLIDLVCSVFETLTADIDFFDLDELPGSGLLLPPVLSKVPLAVALCVSFFFGTIISFYFQQWTQTYSSLNGWIIVDIVSLPVTAYLALCIAAWVLKPLTPLFNRDTFANVDYVGLKARVHSSTINQNIGEVVVNHGGNEYLLDATIEDVTPIEYGDDVIIVGKDKVTNKYIVTKL